MTPQSRTKEGRFRRGQSGNPGGRPATGKKGRELCLEYMEAKGWTGLFELAAKGRYRIQALTLIAAYAYGKPPQPLIGGEEGPPLRIVIEE